MMARQTSMKSVLRSGRMFIASGSPKRALYSISFTPEAVTMNPPYMIPL